MPDERSHPLLQQTPLAVNPFIDLPKPPTLPPNYTSLPFSTLPPSILHTPATTTTTSTSSSSSSNPNENNNNNLPPYVTTPNNTFAAHPSTIIAQNRSLLEQLSRESEEGRKRVEEWEEEIRERELRERRRKAPGWLDREERILEPEKKNKKEEKEGRNLMDEDAEGNEPGGSSGRSRNPKVVGERDVDDLGEAMDRAFGRSEMG